MRRIIEDIPLDKVRPNPFQQRVSHRYNDVLELAASIKEHGLIHPITVRRKNGYYEIASGHGRWLAYEKLGCSSIPAIVCDLNDEEMLQIAMIENLHHRNFTPLKRPEDLILSEEYTTGPRIR